MSAYAVDKTRVGRTSAELARRVPLVNGRLIQAARIDRLLEESAEMGLVEKIAGRWRLTRAGQAWYGDVLRSLPSEFLEEITT